MASSPRARDGQACGQRWGGWLRPGSNRPACRATSGMYRPEFVIVSFIADDSGRTEWARQVGSKPYFVIDEQGNLEFHAMPAVERTILQRILGVSIVTHSLFQRFVDEEGPQFVRVHNRGREVACLLMGRLRALGVSYSTRMLVVGQLQVPDEAPE